MVSERSAFRRQRQPYRNMLGTCLSDVRKTAQEGHGDRARACLHSWGIGRAITDTLRVERPSKDLDRNMRLPREPELLGNDFATEDLIESQHQMA